MRWKKKRNSCGFQIDFEFDDSGDMIPAVVMLCRSCSFDTILDIAIAAKDASHCGNPATFEGHLDMNVTHEHWPASPKSSRNGVFLANARIYGNKVGYITKSSPTTTTQKS
ncbi:hypothetical protein M0R45_025433 [Rubus argutus]|uniref:Uncharacterized protein n=1 Tax=Rubus argutus TaxID=59490 RepID=A0AAW1WY82_RUBAR